MNGFCEFLAEKLLTKEVKNCFIFSPCLSIKKLRKCVFSSFHLHAAYCFANRHRTHLKYRWLSWTILHCNGRYASNGSDMSPICSTFTSVALSEMWAVLYQARSENQ